MATKTIVGHSPGSDWSTLPQSISPRKLGAHNMHPYVPLIVQEDWAMHNHGDKRGKTGTMYYAGYSVTTPNYHVWRCRGSTDCPYTRTFYCVVRGEHNRGKPESMHKTCNVCATITQEAGGG